MLLQQFRSADLRGRHFPGEHAGPQPRLGRRAIQGAWLRTNAFTLDRRRGDVLLLLPVERIRRL